MSERIHFSPIHLNSVLQHQEYGEQAIDRKPNGFWFSVQSYEPEWMGWLEWCRSEDFSDIDNAKAHKIEVDESQILRIGGGDIEWFNETFGIDYCIGTSGYTDRKIRWDAVADQFAGIEISPYSWPHRLDRRLEWYYGWDCASGCIWDTTAIKSIDRIPLILVPSSMDESESGAAK